jgi:hypothetical protein
VSAPLLALALSATVAAGRVQARDPELDPIRAGVINLRDSADIGGGVAGLVGNFVAAGVGITLAVLIGTDVLFESQDSFAKPLIVAALSVGAASQISEALYNIFAEPATVISADELLSDEEALAASGMFFLRDRARDGRDRRIRGIITESTSAAGGIIAGSLLFTQGIGGLGDTERRVFGGIAMALGGVQLISALFKILSKSAEEKVYEAVLEMYGENEPGGPDLGLMIVPDREGGASVGASVGISF